AQVETSCYQPLGGPTHYNLLQQLWSDCPPDPGAVLIGQGEFLAIPNDGADHVTTITIDPPYQDDDDTVWQLIQSDPPSAHITIANSHVAPGRGCSTYRMFAILNGDNSCPIFTFAAPTYGGVYMILYGSPGPTGSCCDLNSGVCTDGVLQSACSNA